MTLIFRTQFSRLEIGEPEAALLTAITCFGDREGFKDRAKVKLNTVTFEEYLLIVFCF